MGSSRASTGSRRGSSSTQTLASSGTTRGSNRSSLRNGPYEYFNNRVVRHNSQNQNQGRNRVQITRSAPDTFSQVESTGPNNAPIPSLPRPLRNPPVDVFQPHPPIPRPAPRLPIPRSTPDLGHTRNCSAPQPTSSVTSQPVYEVRRPSDSGRSNGPRSPILTRFASRPASVNTEIRQPSVGRGSQAPSRASSHRAQRPAPVPAPSSIDPPTDIEDDEDLDPETGMERGLAQTGRRAQARRESAERRQMQDEVAARQQVHERISNAPSRVEGYHDEGNGRIVRTETSRSQPAASSSGRSSGSSRRATRDRDP